jgi:hypothetical protein
MKILTVCLFIAGLIVAFSSTTIAAVKDLVLYYSFDEGKGDKVKDLSGTGNDGTFQTGTVKWVDGKYGGGIQVTKDWIDAGNSKTLNIVDELTVEAWVIPEGAGNRIVCVKPMSDAAWSDPYCAWDLMIHGSMAMEIRFDSMLCQKGSMLPVGKMVHLAITYSKSDKGKVVLYVDGENIGECTRADELKSTETKLRVGSAPNISEPMQGMIDELAIYHRALTQNEIKTDMNAPISTKLGVEPVSKLATTWANIKIGD